MSTVASCLIWMRGCALWCLPCASSETLVTVYPTMQIQATSLPTKSWSLLSFGIRTWSVLICALPMHLYTFLHSMQINTHKKCCESRDSNQNSSRIFSRDLSLLYGSRIDFRIGEMLNMCPFSHAGSLWDAGLSKVALLVHMLELMQGLGRRRTCLRGCVSEGQVVCTDLLPYVL